MRHGKHKKFKMPKRHDQVVMEEVGHELKMNPPKVLARTKAKSGAKRAEKQRVAILLSKARKRGVKIKRRKRSK